MDAGVTPSDLARRLGWYRFIYRRGHFVYVPDNIRVARMLGFWKHGGKFRTHIPYDNAELVCDALNIMPYEVGM